MNDDLRSKAAAALCVFEELDAKLRDRDQDAVAEAKAILHVMIEASCAHRLRIMMLGPMMQMQKDLGGTPSTILLDSEEFAALSRDRDRLDAIEALGRTADNCPTIRVWALSAWVEWTLREAVDALIANNKEQA